MNEMVTPRTSYHAEPGPDGEVPLPAGWHELGEVLKPGQSCCAWLDFDPLVWWWCSSCFHTCQEEQIRVDVNRHGHADVYCPYCEGYNLYWYHGWPSLVLVGWLPEPEREQVFPLPYEKSGERTYNVPLLRQLISLHSPPCNEKPGSSASEAWHPQPMA